MAVTFGLASVKSGGFSAVGSGTFNSPDTAANSNLYGAVGLSHATGVGTNYADTVVWGSVSLAVVTGCQVTNNQNNQVMSEGWAKEGIATGVQTISVDFVGGAHFGTAIAFQLYSVDQTTPSSGGVSVMTANGTTSTLDVASASGDMVIDMLGCDINSGATSGWTAGTGQDAHSTPYGGGLGVAGGMSSEAGGSTVTMSWSWTTNATSAQVAWNVKAAAGGTVVRMLSLLGVGT